MKELEKNTKIKEEVLEKELSTGQNYNEELLQWSNLLDIKEGVLNKDG